MTEAIGGLVRPIRVVAVFVLVAIGVRGLLALRREIRPGRSERLTSPLLETYLRVLGLTLLNPATIVYFAALILGLPALGGFGERLAFVAGAGLGSLGWQCCLAGLGSLAHRRLSERAQRIGSVAGNLVVLVFAAAIAYGLLTS